MKFFISPETSLHKWFSNIQNWKYKSLFKTKIILSVRIFISTKIFFILISILRLYFQLHLKWEQRSRVKSIETTKQRWPLSVKYLLHVCPIELNVLSDVITMLWMKTNKFSWTNISNIIITSIVCISYSFHTVRNLNGFICNVWLILELLYFHILLRNLM